MLVSMSEMCYRCYKPKNNCLCPYITETDTGVKFVILMHPKEAYHQRTGTGRLTALSLKNSEIRIGIDFTDDEKLNGMLCDSRYQPFLLFPGKDFQTAETLQEIPGKQLLVVVIDGTWPCAKKILRLSSNLRMLPTLSFSGNYRSAFAFKREPSEECLSTIESCYYLVRELQRFSKAKQCDVSSMLTVFSKMVEHQIVSEKRRKTLGGNDSFHLRCGS
ncbi:MAG: tRNA-uridine aminocarboxypropyltransferase [Sphaerochaetaceae bacterium]